MPGDVGSGTSRRRMNLNLLPEAGGERIAAKPPMPDQPPPDRSDSRRQIEAFFSVIAVVAAGFLFVLSIRGMGFDAEPANQREYLQALSIRSLAAEGPRLDAPVPVLGYPWELPRPFALHANLSAVASRGAGWNEVVAGRTVSLAFLLLALPAFHLAVREIGGTSAQARFSVALLLVGPLSREHALPLTEGMAGLALTLWWFWAFAASSRLPRLLPRILLVPCGALAAMVEPVVFAPFALAGALLVTQRVLPVRRLELAIAYGPALLAALGWAFHMSALRTAHPFGELFAGLGSRQIFGWSDLGRAEFWGALLGLAGQLVSPLALLLLLALGARAFVEERKRFVAHAGAALAALFLFLPAYQGHPAALLAVAALVAVMLAQLLTGVFRFASAGIAPVVAAAALVFGGQASQPSLTTRADSRLELPRVRELAEGIRLATAPGDIVLTLGQQFDPQFLYHTHRRGLSVPSGAEDDLVRLERALGPGNDRHFGAVVLTGRFRAEAGHIAWLRERLGLAAHPVLRTDASDVLVPAATFEHVRATVHSHDQLYTLVAPEPGPPPEPSPAANEPTPATPAPPPSEPFVMMRPHPFRHRVPYDLAAHGVDGRPHFFAHAPTELEFHVPANATEVVLEFFMPEGAYTDKGDTDGAEVALTVVRPSGETEEIYRRLLEPRRVAGDRREVVAAVPLRAPPGSTLRFESRPGPAGRSNFDWVYVRRLEIR